MINWGASPTNLNTENTMAQKIMHRVLDLSTGRILVTDWVYDGYVSLNEIHIDYDDTLKPEHAQMVADAIDKRVKKLHADIVVMENKKQDFLALTNKGPITGEWEEVPDGN